uniref:Uncharacterized protein n=1 Tax=Rhizophora mucronata TaxID=61149 RepID=A0A2P2QFR7_RHIMU
MKFDRQTYQANTTRQVCQILAAKMHFEELENNWNAYKEKIKIVIN